MAIPSKQIGWSTTDNLLWQISKQLEQLIKVTTQNNPTTTTTTLPPVFEYSLDAQGWEFGGSACNNFGASGYTTLYATTNDPLAVTAFYFDPSLSSIFGGGGGNYYAYALSSDIGSKYSAQIGSGGDVVNNSSCSAFI